MDDKYYTISNSAKYEIKIKGSRFIAECGIASSIEDASGMLESIRKREHAATHHCYAWNVGHFNDQTYKYSDDGEPSGTAGKPIYDVICGRGLSNIVMVVTRYYGGTKLGTGGLVRAYGGAAIGALDKARKKENFLTNQYKVQIEFSLYDQMARLINKLGAKQVNAEYSDIVTLTLEIRVTKSPLLLDEILQLSNGKAVIEKIC